MSTDDQRPICVLCGHRHYFEADDAGFDTAETIPWGICVHSPECGCRSPKYAPRAEARAEAPLTQADEAFALDYDPWGERDATYRTLNDRFVVTRKPATCAICLDGIPIGSRIRAKTEVDDGRCKTFKFCPECCRLMANRRDDDAFERLLVRYDLGRKSAEDGR